MIGPTGAIRVMVATKPVDFCKGEASLARDPETPRTTTSGGRQRESSLFGYLAMHRRFEQIVGNVASNPEPAIPPRGHSDASASQNNRGHFGPGGPV